MAKRIRRWVTADGSLSCNQKTIDAMNADVHGLGTRAVLNSDHSEVTLYFPGEEPETYFLAPN